MPAMGLAILIGLLLLGTGLGLRAVIEPHCPEFSYVKINPNEEKQEGLRILFLSDYHYPLDLIPPETVLEYALNQEADLVVLGGDMFSDATDLDRAVFLLNRLNSLLEDRGILFLAIRGNHDVGLSQDVCDFPLLINQHYYVRDKSGRDWKILGLDDIRLGKVDPLKAEKNRHPDSPLPSTETNNTPSDRSVFLAHNPDTILRLDSSMAKFCLSGHFHGGQIKLLGLEYALLRKEVLCRVGIVSGLNPVRGMYHYISRGFGNVLFPFRLGARPELTLLDLHPAVKPIDSSEQDKKIKVHVEKHGYLYP